MNKYMLIILLIYAQTHQVIILIAYSLIILEYMMSVTQSSFSVLSDEIIMFVHYLGETRLTTSRPDCRVRMCDMS